MLADADISVVQIAYRLGVSTTTLYRYIPVCAIQMLQARLSRDGHMLDSLREGTNDRSK
jgi:hypothetical protein